jgi:L-iditol 2-dehydrogenase
MKALVKYGMGENDIELREIPEPVPQSNEVKVKVEATGICGTDLYGYSALKPPVVLGRGCGRSRRRSKEYKNR